MRPDTEGQLVPAKPAALKRGEFGRRQEVEALSTMRGMDLADPEVMERAWRS